jgi:hypothetical protein
MLHQNKKRQATTSKLLILLVAPTGIEPVTAP